MSRGKQTLLVTTALLLAATGLQAGLWRSRKPQQSTQTAPAAVAMSLTAVDADSSRVMLHTSGTPVYTSYSPSPGVFIIDLTGTERPSELKLPATLPAPVTSISAEEAVEMGSKLTRVTFRMTQTVVPQASVADNTVIVTMPAAVAATQEAPAASTEKPAEVAAQPVKTEPLPAPPAAKTAEPVGTVTESLPNAKSVRRVTTAGQGGALEVDITGDGAMNSYKAFRLNNPERLVIDINGVKNHAKPAVDVNEGAVKRVRIAQFAPAVTRVVLDLTGKTEYAVTPSRDMLRVTFGENAKIAAAAPVMPAVTAEKKEQPVKVAAATDIPSQVPTIAEDAAWKMPGAKPVINAPEDQTPPATPSPARKAVGTARTTAATAGTTGENVFDEAAAATPPPQVGGGPTGGRTLSGSQRVFTGDPISLNLKDADIKDVLRTFSQLTGLNIAIDPNVNGTVTVDFTDVPWDQALDLILRQNGLTFILEGNVMRVGTIDRLATETAAAAKLAEQERLNVPLTTLSFKLSYAKAPEVSSLLKDLASPRARIIVDSRTNQLIISEIPQYLQVMRNLIDTVDIPNRQVVIEARIVETTKTFSLQYGFSWNFGGVLDPALGTGTGLIFPNRVGFNGGPFSFTGGGSNVLGLSLTDVLGTFNLDLALAASETNGLTRVISAPKVTTQDNTPAEIQSGVQIPIQTRVNFTTTIQYIAATLTLSVTPQITEAGTIIMDISVQKTTPGAVVEGTAGASLNTRTAHTRVMVRDGGTAVIGGIYQATDNNSQSGVPVLKDIPVLGALFKSHREDKSNDELLIFVTPRIIRGT
ncbi:MAG TPA: type IV pilus secretin PilQ [Thermoanaerobaculia bacterium]|nr:type IV pilus secretin PilQ [Thermoanaerobaculia bacterium]